MTRKVVVTGMGVISPNGIGVDEFWENCLKAKTVVEPIPDQWTRFFEFNSPAWAPLPPLDFARFGFGTSEQYRLDPVSLLALDATFQALGQAGLPCSLLDCRRNTYEIAGISGDRTGIFLGTGVGGVNTSFASHAFHILARQKSELKKIREKAVEATWDAELLAELGEMEANMIIPKRMNPFAVSMLMPNAPAANIGIKFNLSGPNRTFCSACASGLVALGHAFDAIQRGLVDVAIAGGAEYLADAHGGVFRGFDMVKTLANGDCDISKLNRPFDEARSGFLFCEGGAGIFIIEALEHAQNRQAVILAEIVGYAENCDGFNIMIPDETGDQVKRMYQKLFEDTALRPEQVDYINAHGTGTVMNDLIEAKVIEAVFGKKVRVNSTKSLIGHSIGASGAIETIVTVLSLKDQTTHICNNLARPIRDLNFVTQVQAYSMEIAINQSFAFGGHNASLVLKKWQG